MGRRPPLRCWWGDVHVADIEALKPWDLRCRYTAEALDRWAIGTPLLSCSLPVETRPRKATNFFRGLLPEGRHLQAVAHRAKVTTNDYYGLLARFGRDIAGALVITTGDVARPRHGSVAEYSAEELDQEIASLGDNSLGLHPDSELSIAGVQNKLLLVKLAGGRWGRPMHGYPSTHILKIDDERFPGLVRAEGECLALAHAIGVTDVAPHIERLAGVESLIVERYDRAVAEGVVMRNHQEDACQALDVDIDANRGRGKYEAHGGPTLHKVADLLQVNARAPAAEIEKLVRLVTFTASIGNADLHGKNISLIHDEAGNVALAPAYDTVPTMMWPTLRATSAVAIDGIVDFARIRVGNIAAEASAWGLSPERAQEVAVSTVEAIVESVPDVIESTELANAIRDRTATLLS